MPISFLCSKIESSFKDDNLIFPRKGECILINEKVEDASLVLKIKKDSRFYDDATTDLFEQHTHKVFY